MTLSEAATYITTKLNDTSSASVTACKTFLNRGYEFAWNSALWTETLGVASTAVVAGDTSITLDDTPSITFFHSGSAPTTYIDFPVAVKMTETGYDDGINVSHGDWVTFFQIDPNAWIDVSTRRAIPTGYINLPKDGSGYARIKPVPVPQSDGTLYVLGKLKWVALGDSDTPCLRGFDNAWLCLAEKEMLERARQYGKAAQKLTEAMGHMQVMRDMERGQAQSVSRIIPLEEGYDDIVSPQ